MIDTDIGDYTDAEVMEQLRKGYREERFRYEHLDNINQSMRYLSTVEQGANIDYQFFADIKRTMNLRMLETAEESKLIKFERDRIRIHMDLRMPDGLFARRPLGVYLTSSPKRSSNQGIVTLEISGFDLSLVLRENTIETTLICQGAVIVTEKIKAILSENGLDYVVTSAATTFGTERMWPVGTTHAQIVQDMIDRIGYASIWFDGNGVAQVHPYVLPENRTAEIRYATDEFSIIKEEATDLLDLFKIPNRWTSVRSQADQSLLTATITNNNPDDPTSTVGRGRIITDLRTDSDALDQNALNQQVRRIAAEAQQKYREIEFTTALVPLHGEATTVELNHDPLSLKDVYNETKWSMDLRPGGLMSHSARKSVKVSAVT